MTLRRRYLHLVREHQPYLWAAAVVASCLAGLGMLRLRFEDDPQNLYRQNNDDFAELEQLQAEFGSFDDEVLVVVTSDELFSNEGVKAFRSLVEQIRGIGGVREVFSMLDVRRTGSRLMPLVPYDDRTVERYLEAKRDALRHPVVAGRLLSADGRTALVVVQLEGPWPNIHAVQPVVDQIRRATREAAVHSSLRATISGMPVVRLDSLATVQREQLKFTILALLVSTAVSWFVFRQLTAVVVATSAPLLGTFWALGLMGWMGFSINGFNMLLPTLVLVLGFTDALHLVVDVRRSLAEGRTRKQAAVAAIDRLIVPCFLTSFTTAIGFASLALSRTVSIREFGCVCACGAMLSFLAVIVATPLLCSSPLGLLLDPRRGIRKQRRAIPAVRSPAQLAFLLRWPRTRIFVAAAYVALFAPMAWRLTPDVRSTEAIPERSETIKTLRACDEAFGGSLPVFLVLQWPSDAQFLSSEVLGSIQEIHAIVLANGTLSRPFSVLDVLKVLPGEPSKTGVERHLAQFPPELRQRLLRRDLRKVVISFRVRDLGASALQPTWEQLEASLVEFHHRHPGFQVQLTGNTVVAARNLQQIIRDLAQSLGVAAVIIVGVLTLVFRSLVVGLISILPNTFPLITNAVLLVACNLPLQLTSVITFSLCLGIAVDDTIHFLMRFERERQAGWGVETALLRTYYYVGRVLVATSVILGGGFAVIALSAVPAMRLFALLSCTAVLAALVGDLVVLPALLQSCASRAARGRQRV